LTLTDFKRNWKLELENWKLELLEIGYLELENGKSKLLEIGYWSFGKTDVK